MAALQLLRLRLPGVALAPDITSLMHLPPGTQIVSAGFPCIDLSRAGLRTGIQLGQARPLACMHACCYNSFQPLHDFYAHVNM